MTGDNRLATFPHDDEAFAAFVRETARAAGDCSPADLEDLLRRWYPEVHVSVQQRLAALGKPLWYVFRDGRPRVPDGGKWWLAADTARVEFDSEGVLRDVNEHAASLAGMPPSAMVGKRWSEFVDAEIADDDPAWLWQTLRTRGYVHSIFRLVRPDGSKAWVEYRSEAVGGDTFASFWRQVALEPDTRSQP